MGNQAGYIYIYFFFLFFFQKKPKHLFGEDLSDPRNLPDATPSEELVFRYINVIYIFMLYSNYLVGNKTLIVIIESLSRFCYLIITGDGESVSYRTNIPVRSVLLGIPNRLG